MSDQDIEFDVIQTIIRALEPLDEDAKERVIDYVSSKVRSEME